MRSGRLCVLALATQLSATAVHAQEDPEISAMVLNEATAACKSRDVDGFVAVFIESDTVRKAYTAKDLTVVENSASGQSVATVAGAAYSEFPLAVFDYYYTTALGVDENGYTHVLIKKSLSADNTLQVDWVRVTYDGNGEGDDPGAIVEKGAEPGSLQFTPTATCWELVRVETTRP